MLTAACSGADEPAEPSSGASTPAAPTSTPTATDDAAPGAIAGSANGEPIEVSADGTVTTSAPALEITTDTESARDCFAERFSDIGILDFQVRTAADIHSVRFRLLDPQGVRLVGRPILVPALNRGGSIPYGGSVTWEDRSRVLSEQRFIDWSSREGSRFFEPVAGGSYLVVAHIEFTEERASYAGMGVDYRLSGTGIDPVGPRLTSEARSDITVRVPPDGQRC